MTLSAYDEGRGGALVPPPAQGRPATLRRPAPPLVCRKAFDAYLRTKGVVIKTDKLGRRYCRDNGRPVPCPPRDGPAGVQSSGPQQKPEGRAVMSKKAARSLLDEIDDYDKDDLRRIGHSLGVKFRLGQAEETMRRKVRDAIRQELERRPARSGRGVPDLTRAIDPDAQGEVTDLYGTVSDPALPPGTSLTVDYRGQPRRATVKRTRVVGHQRPSGKLDVLIDLVLDPPLDPDEPQESHSFPAAQVVAALRGSEKPSPQAAPAPAAGGPDLTDAATREKLSEQLWQAGRKDEAELLDVYGAEARLEGGRVVRDWPVSVMTPRGEERRVTVAASSLADAGRAVQESLEGEGGDLMYALLQDDGEPFQDYEYVPRTDRPSPAPQAAATRGGPGEAREDDPVAQGDSWESPEGTRRVVGVRPDGRLLISTDGRPFHVILSPEELDKEKYRDTANVESRRKAKAREDEERDAEAARKKADPLEHFLTDRSVPPMRAAKIRQALSRGVRWKKNVVPLSRFVVEAVSEGAVIRNHPKYGRVMAFPDGTHLEEKKMGKWVFDFAEYMSERNP